MSPSLYKAWRRSSQFRTAFSKPVVHGPRAPELPGNLLEKQILRPYPRLTDSKSLAEGSSNLCLIKPPANRGLCSILRTVVVNNTNLYGMAPWRILHRSLRCKIEIFHNLEPPCCVKWPMNLTYRLYVPLWARGACIWCGEDNYGASWHARLSLLPLPMPPNGLCSWSIRKMWFQIRSLTYICSIWHCDSLWWLTESQPAFF